jgi:hypothetical protein
MANNQLIKKNWLVSLILFASISTTLGQNISWKSHYKHKISKCTYCGQKIDEVLPIKIICSEKRAGEVAVLEASQMYPNQVSKTNFINESCKGKYNPNIYHDLSVVSENNTSMNRNGTVKDANEVQELVKNNFNSIQKSIFTNNCLKVILIAIINGRE